MALGMCSTPVSLQHLTNTCKRKKEEEEGSCVMDFEQTRTAVERRETRVCVSTILMVFSYFLLLLLLLGKSFNGLCVCVYTPAPCTPIPSIAVTV